MWAIEDEGLTGVTIDSDGHRLVGVLYLARGEEPKPTVLLLHGCPGLEKNLDLAVRLRDQGWNSLLFHYRGCWGSAGRYDLRTIPRDVTAAVDYLAGCPRVDAGRIAVLGHSLGGWAALVTAAAEPRLRAVAVYGAAARPGASLRLSPDQMSTDQMSTDQMSTDQMSTDQMSTDQIEAEFTRFLATTPAEFARQAEEVAERMDGLEAAAAIGPRPLLVVHGTADRWVPVAAARELAARAGPGCRYVEVEGADHAFSWHRAELSDLIIGWLRGENYAT
jgi:pentapeptide MXKDX repeat protein